MISLKRNRIYSYPEKLIKFSTFNKKDASKLPIPAGFVPTGYVQNWLNFNNTEIANHLLWIAQKNTLKQDMFLLGPPGELKRRLVMTMAELCGWEVEYLHISRDTTESDIKQRREIVGTSSIYVDQAPVRAAIYGRILILDGIENAERNVLPTLNNLLENREMSLEDGRFLIPESTYRSIVGGLNDKNQLADTYMTVPQSPTPISQLVPVSPNFRVVALSTPVPPYPGRTIDPPLRSRFQCRYIDDLNVNTVSSNISTPVFSMMNGIEKIHEMLYSGTTKANVGDLQILKTRKLLLFYDSLCSIRNNALATTTSGDSNVSSLPLFSLSDVQFCDRLSIIFPELPLSYIVNLVVPSMSVNAKMLANLRSWRPILFEPNKIGIKFMERSISSFDPAIYPASFSESLKFAFSMLDDSSTGTRQVSTNVIVNDGKLIENLNLTGTQLVLLNDLFISYCSGKHLCLLGPKGSGKSYIITALTSLLFKLQLGPQISSIRTFPMYRELSVRDLLQRRVTRSVSNGNTSSEDTAWVDSPLIAAAKDGSICVLDGIERLDIHVLSSLRRLIQDGELDLPSGEKLLSYDKFNKLVKEGFTDNICQIHSNFRIIGLGSVSHNAINSVGVEKDYTVSTQESSPGNAKVLNDCRQRYLTSDIGFLYHFVPSVWVNQGSALGSEFISGCTLNDVEKLISNEIEHIFSLDTSKRKHLSVLNMYKKVLLEALSGLNVASGSAKYVQINSKMNKTVEGVDNSELKPSLRHALNIFRQFLYKIDTFPLLGEENSEKILSYIKAEVFNVVKETFLVKFLPKMKADAFYFAFQNVGFGVQKNNFYSFAEVGLPIQVSEKDGLLSIGSSVLRVSTAQNPEKVPNPLYYDNTYHTILLSRLVDAFSGANARTDRVQTYGSTRSNSIPSFLLIGNQGVGKNKLIDRFLYLANLEREYIQLHRDTSIQSLTVTPSLDKGKITYIDSPLIVAARNGCVVVIDEADKAPLEVVCLLKNLIEDGELVLYDGRRLMNKSRIAEEFGDSINMNEIIPIHPNFRVVVLANRPGFPFLGNNFYRECGDVFQGIFVVDNLDQVSELKLLRSYAPSLSNELLISITEGFKALREQYDSGKFPYPFSVREAVAVVKHLENFPRDGIAEAFENVLSFDGGDFVTRERVAQIFQSCGLLIPLKRNGGTLDTQNNGGVSLLPDWQKHVQLSPFFKIPESFKANLESSHVICANKSLLPRSSIMKLASNHILIDNYDMNKRIRMFQFSEEFGRIYLSKSELEDEYGSQSFGALGVYADNSNSGVVIQAISQYPIALNSVFGVVQEGDFQQKYIRRILFNSAELESLRRRSSADIDTLLVSPINMIGNIISPTAVILPKISQLFVIPPSLSVSQNEHMGSNEIYVFNLPKRTVNDNFHLKVSSNRRNSSGIVAIWQRPNDLTDLKNLGSENSVQFLNFSGNRDYNSCEVYTVFFSMENIRNFLGEKFSLIFQDSNWISFINCVENIGIDKWFCEVDLISSNAEADALQLGFIVDLNAEFRSDFILSGCSPNVSFFDSKLSPKGKITNNLLEKYYAVVAESSDITSWKREIEYSLTNKSSTAPASGFLSGALNKISGVLNKEIPTSDLLSSRLVDFDKASYGKRKVVYSDKSLVNERGTVTSILSSGDSKSLGSVLEISNVWNGETKVLPICNGRPASFDSFSAKPSFRKSFGSVSSSSSPRESYFKDLLSSVPATIATRESVAIASDCDFFPYELKGKSNSIYDPSSTIDKHSVYYNSDIIGCLTLPLSNGGVVSAVCHSNGLLRLFDAASTSEEQENLNKWRLLLGHFKGMRNQELVDLGILGSSGQLLVGSGGGLVADALTSQGELQLLLEKMQDKLQSISAADAMQPNVGHIPSSTPRTGSNLPKHGKEDEKNEHHVGGNQWAGGSGGSDTAGLGGRGGPYRLDKGHKTHQISDEDKANISEESKRKAAEMNRIAFAERLKESNLDKKDFELYSRYKERVQGYISSMRLIFAEESRRVKERVWLKRQMYGELDDSKLVDGITGDRLIFKRRGIPNEDNLNESLEQEITNDLSGEIVKKRIMFVVDVSASMYRFNGEDQRLERLLEGCLMIMEALIGNDNIEYSIIGHSGDSYEIPFISFKNDEWSDEAVAITNGISLREVAQLRQTANTKNKGMYPVPSNAAEQMFVLRNMAAHSQFSMPGDNTLKATEQSVARMLRLSKNSSANGELTDNYIVVISDANFRRYNISPNALSRLMTNAEISNGNLMPKVHAIFISSLFDNEAERIVSQLPAGKGHVCMNTSDLPGILKDILVSTGTADSE